jgi:hypothetical protein
MSCVRTCLFVSMIVSSFAACSDSPGRLGDPPDPAEIGAAHQPFCLGHAIANVVVAPGTFHWEDLPHLLDSTEGFGPRTLALSVNTTVSATSSSTSTFTPSDSEISASAGYDVSKSFEVDAFSSVFVPFAAYARLEAYASYQMTTWDVIGTACTDPGPVVLGTGVSFKPVGVFFKTCETMACLMGGPAGGPILNGPSGSSASSTAGVGGSGMGTGAVVGAGGSGSGFGVGSGGQGGM